MIRRGFISATLHLPSSGTCRFDRLQSVWSTSFFSLCKPSTDSRLAVCQSFSASILEKHHIVNGDHWTKNSRTIHIKTSMYGSGKDGRVEEMQLLAYDKHKSTLLWRVERCAKNEKSDLTEKCSMEKITDTRFSRFTDEDWIMSEGKEEECFLLEWHTKTKNPSFIQYSQNGSKEKLRSTSHLLRSSFSKTILSFKKAIQL